MFQQTDDDHPFNKGLETLQLKKILERKACQQLFVDEILYFNLSKGMLKRNDEEATNPYQRLAESAALEVFFLFSQINRR